MKQFMKRQTRSSLGFNREAPDHQQVIQGGQEESRSREVTLSAEERGLGGTDLEVSGRLLVLNGHN